MPLVFTSAIRVIGRLLFGSSIQMHLPDAIGQGFGLDHPDLVGITANPPGDLLEPVDFETHPGSPIILERDLLRLMPADFGDVDGDHGSKLQLHVVALAFVDQLPGIAQLLVQIEPGLGKLLLEHLKTLDPCQFENPNLVKFMHVTKQIPGPR